jgi:hypothetical protein
MTESQQEVVIHQKPRPVWVLSLAVGELAAIIIAALIFARLGIQFPPASATLVAIFGAGFLAYRVERRHPGTMTWMLRISLAAQVSVLLAIVNGLAFYYRGAAPTVGYALMITALGTLFMILLHLVGLQAGVSTAKAVRHNNNSWR